MGENDPYPTAILCHAACTYNIAPHSRLQDQDRWAAYYFTTCGLLWNQLFRPICVGAGSRPCPRRSNPRPSRSALLCRPPSTRLTTGKESFRSRRLCCSSRRCLYTPETIWFFPPITSVFRYRLSVTRFCEISRLWQNIISLWQCFDGLFSIWQNCEPTLVNILCFWANIHRCKGPKIERII